MVNIDWLLSILATTANSSSLIWNLRLAEQRNLFLINLALVNLGAPVVESYESVIELLTASVIGEFLDLLGLFEPQLQAIHIAEIAIEIESVFVKSEE